MKERGRLVAYVVAALMLAHLIVVAGCGRNPLMGILGTGMSVGVGRM